MVEQKGSSRDGGRPSDNGSGLHGEGKLAAGMVVRVLRGIDAREQPQHPMTFARRDMQSSASPIGKVHHPFLTARAATRRDR